MIETSASTPTLPPRPNLGPEPLGESRSPVALLGFVCFALLVLALVVTWFRARRRNRMRPAPQPPAQRSEPADVPGAQPHSLVALAQRCRDALVARFGDRWAAKTTEEIGADRELADQLGSEPVSDLLRLLREADRIKFAQADPGDDASENWQEWVSRFTADIASEAQQPRRHS